MVEVLWDVSKKSGCIFFLGLRDVCELFDLTLCTLCSDCLLVTETVVFQNVQCDAIHTNPFNPLSLEQYLTVVKNIKLPDRCEEMMVMLQEMIGDVARMHYFGFAKNVHFSVKWPNSANVRRRRCFRGDLRGVGLFPSPSLAARQRWFLSSFRHRWRVDVQLQPGLPWQRQDPVHVRLF